MCLGSVWNKRFPFDLSASSIAVTMFFISTARAEANCSALIALGAWDVTTGVEEWVGAKPGISLFLFLFRPLLCFSALVPVFEDAILLPEAAGNQYSGFIYFICAFVFECDSCLRSRVFVQLVAVFCEVNVYMQIYYFAFLPSCVRLPLVVECWGQWDVGYCQSYSKAYGIGELSFDKKSNVPLQDLGSFSVWCAKLMRTCREPREKHLWAYYKILWTFLHFLSACYGFYKRWKSSNDIGRNRKLFYIPSDAMKNLLAQARTSLLGLPFQ